MEKLRKVIENLYEDHNRITAAFNQARLNPRSLADADICPSAKRMKLALASLSLNGITPAVDKTFVPAVQPAPPAKNSQNSDFQSSSIYENGKTRKQEHGPKIVLPAITANQISYRSAPICELLGLWFRELPSGDRGPIISRTTVGGRTFQLYLADFQTLRTVKTWLNTNVMEFLMNTLLLGKKDAFYFDHNLLHDIHAGKESTWARNLMKRKSFDERSKGYSFLNMGNHWILVILDFAKKQVTTVDSSPNQKGIFTASMVARNFTHYLNMRAEILGQPTTAYWSANYIIPTPQQDTNNCGIFTLENCRMILDNRSCLTENSDHFDLMRKRISFGIYAMFSCDALSTYCSSCGGLDEEGENGEKVKLINCDRCKRLYHLNNTCCNYQPGTSFHCTLCTRTDPVMIHLNAAFGVDHVVFTPASMLV